MGETRKMGSSEIQPFHLDGNKEIDMLKAPLHINVPKGTEPVVFYIDDITFEKVD